MNNIASLAISLTLLLSVLGCDQTSATLISPSTTQINNDKIVEKTIISESKKVLVKHASGETWVMNDPQRIITLDFGTLDSLDNLGLADRIIGLPKTNVPDYLQQYRSEIYTDIGNIKQPNFETIQQLKPDLIVITGRQRNSYSSLSAIAPTIDLSIDSKNSHSSFVNNMNILGMLFNKQHEITQELANLDKSMAEYRIKAQQSNLKALVILHNANKLSVINNGSYAAIVHDWVGLKRADQDTDTKNRVADDIYLTTINPDIIFIIDRSAAIGQNRLDPALLATGSIKSLNAYKNGKIIYLTSDLWYLSGGGLESLPIQLKEVISALN